MSWQKPSDAAAEAAVWGLIETEAKKRKDEARAWLTDRMGPDLLAVKAVANGQDVGRASYVEGKPTFKVADPQAFRDFVRAVYPTEMVEQPNPAWLRSYLTLLQEVDGTVIDDNGTVVAGVEKQPANPYVTVKKSADARAKVAELLAGGRLSLEGIQPEPVDRWTEDMEVGAIG